MRELVFLAFSASISMRELVFLAFSASISLRELVFIAFSASISMRELVFLAFSASTSMRELVFTGAVVVADLVKLHSAEKVETLKCRIIDALQYTVLEQHGGDIGRLSQLLMLLPHVRQVAMQTIQHFLSLSAHCILPKFALLKEMVEAFVKVLGMPMVEDIEMAHSPAAPLPPPASPTSTLN